MTDLSMNLHCRGTNCWSVTDLWELSKDLTPFFLPISSFDYQLEKDSWFSYIDDKGNSMIQLPNLKALIQHYKRIMEADLIYPIILCPENKIMDGVHRLAKYHVLNIPQVKCVRFEEMPPVLKDELCFLE
jgi:disulfide oxidoreductase YuzD